MLKNIEFFQLERMQQSTASAMLVHRLQRWANIKTTLGRSTVFTQQTRYIDPMLVQCWFTVYDADPTLDQH